MTTRDDIHDMPQREVFSQRLNADALCVLGRTVASWLNRKPPRQSSRRDR
jgi:hypothetical protein